MNDFLNDVGAFWDRIAPYVFAHLIGLLTLRFIGGVKLLRIRDRWEQFEASEAYRRWRRILDEFELRPKLPFIAVGLIALYFVLFQRTEQLLSEIPVPPFRIAWSEDTLWRDSKPFVELRELVSLRGRPNEAEVWKLLEVKDNALEQMRAKFPKRYDEYVGWRDKEYERAATAFRLTVL